MSKAAGEDGADAPELEGWVTLAEAAAMYGVPRERLQRAVVERRLAARKFGRSATGRRLPWRVQPEQVEHFLQEFASRARGRGVAPPVARS